VLGKVQIRVEWLKVRATVTGTESSFAQIENPEVVVPDNMQLGLCITVMAGNDMENTCRTSHSFYFAFFIPAC
jgi:outer membrane protein W